MLKVVLQDGMKDCGICCLLSVIRFYGGEVSKEHLRELTNTNKDGVSAYNLIEAAKVIGLDAYGVSGELNNIDDYNLPCIAHVNVNSNYQHFVVIYKIDSKKITIMDPAVGKRVLKLSEFKLMSTSNYIFLKAKKKLPIIKNSKEITYFINKYIRNHKYFFILLSFLSLNILFFDILFTFNFKYIINYSINYYNSVNLITISFLLVCISFCHFLLNILTKKLMYKIIFIFDEQLTLKTFKQLLLLPYFYYKNRTVGEVLSRFNDLTTIKSYLVKIISIFLTDIISLLVFIIFLFKINHNLALFILIYIVLISILIFSTSNYKKGLFKRVKSDEDIIEQHIIESISNVDTTKGSHLEKRFSDKFNLKYRRLLSNNYRYVSLVDFIDGLIRFIKNLLIVCIYSIGGYYVLINELSINNMIIFQSFFSYTLSCFDRLLNIFLDISTYKICLNRVEDLYTILEEDFSKNFYYLNYRLDGDITINNLYYEINNRVIFNNINLVIRNSEKVLLFGSSGSGKSTLVKMLLRYVEVPFSMISINGIDINHYHLENIRRYITYVSSNELLFNDTIYNNICLYKEVSEELFIKIIKICRVDKIFGEDINNYKCILEENGFLLSSGERQRIILARSLLRDSDIYIYDEAFGQIDIDLTNKILSDIFKYLKDKKVIVISHRNNSKKYFDKIYKIIDGNIYEK